MRIAFVTLFPDWIRSSLSHSILARAESSGLVEFTVVNPRSYCYDPHKKVDDVPYGGHPGMLMKAEPVALAIESILGPSPFSLEGGGGGVGVPQKAPSSLREEGVGDGGASDDHYNDTVGVMGSNPIISTIGSSNLLLSSTSERGKHSEPHQPDKDASQDRVREETCHEGTFHVEEAGDWSLRQEPDEGNLSNTEALARTEPNQATPLSSESLRTGGVPTAQGTHNSKIAIILTEPSGIPFTQSHAQDLAAYDQVIFVCGHYEGIDHRIEETFATHVFSIGDYVLTNGELPALVMADAVVRLIPGVLGNEGSLDEESFQNDLLGAPNYTRPEVWRGIPIPDVLKSGNHKEIEKWRKAQAKERTQQRRPDLGEKSSE